MFKVLTENRSLLCGMVAGFVISVGGIVLVLTLIFSDFLIWPKSESDEPYASGNEIVKALESYRSDHGEYPVMLKELVPVYFNEIPEPGWGENTWEYMSHPEIYLRVGWGDDDFRGVVYSGSEGWSLES